MTDLRFPWEGDPPRENDPLREGDPAPAAEVSLPPESPSKKVKRGRRPVSFRAASAQTGPGWLFHHLTISGPAMAVSVFAAAARGSGIIPWHLDFDLIEEDVFNIAAAQPAAGRSLDIAGCRILARQFRERVEARQAKAMALVERSWVGAASQACSFDLQMLLPVPASILQLGPSHATALAWLADHWGTTDRLRQVVERRKPSTGRRRPAGQVVIGYGFFTAGETPHPAIAQLGVRYPELRFVLRPRPDPPPSPAGWPRPTD